MSDLTPLSVAELAARKLEASARSGPIYAAQAGRIVHEIRCLNDADAAQAVHRVPIAAAGWRSYQGPVDMTDPSEWDPAVRREFEAVEELKAALDSFDALVGLGQVTEP